MLSLEKVACTRCGGAKIFPMWGHIAQGRCFKCAGSGWQYTRAGKKAADAFNAALPRKRADEIVVGDRVREMGFVPMTGDSYHYWATVTEVQSLTDAETRAHRIVDGAPVPNVGYLRIRTEAKFKSGRTEVNNGENPPNKLYEMGFSTADAQRILGELKARRFKGVIELPDPEPVLATGTAGAEAIGQES